MTNTNVQDNIWKSPIARFSVKDLGLTIKDRTVLNDINFDLQEGEILGILGPNGSGKSSLIRCLSGLWKPNCGSMHYNNRLLKTHDHGFRSHIGVVFQSSSLDEKMTARENLLMGAALFKIKGDEAKKRSEELIDFVQLMDRADDIVKTFSEGMQRRLEICRALIHKPSILFFDEPTTGLDLYAFELMWERLYALRKEQNLSMLISTHRSDEAERCDRIIILNQGKIVAMDTPKNFISSVGGDILLLETNKMEILEQELKKKFDFPTHKDNNYLVVKAKNAHELIPRMIEIFPKGILKSISIRNPSLSDAFFHITGKTLTHRKKENIHG